MSDVAPASTLTPLGLQAWQVAAGAFVSNCYVHASVQPGECVLVDPGLDPQAIDTHLQALGLRPLAVLCTHGHFDHVGGAAWFQQRYGVPVHLPEREVATMKASNFLLMAMRMPQRIELPQASLVKAGDAALQIGGRSYAYLACPGHTAGSSLICCEGLAFSGDSIYARGVGLSRLPGEDHAQLRASLLGLWEQLPADVLVCPGHGACATWGEIRQGNAALREFLGLHAGEGVA